MLSRRLHELKQYELREHIKVAQLDSCDLVYAGGRKYLVEAENTLDDCLAGGGVSEPQRPYSNEATAPGSRREGSPGQPMESSRLQAPSGLTFYFDKLC